MKYILIPCEIGKSVLGVCNTPCTFKIQEGIFVGSLACQKCTHYHGMLEYSCFVKCSFKYDNS